MADQDLDPYMSDSDAIMWTIERDPLLRSTIVVVMTLDRPPDWDRLVASAEAAVATFPRLRQVVAETPLRAAPPRWVDARRFDVRTHLHHFGCPAPHDLTAALELATVFAERAFDRSQPLWQLAVIDGLDDDRAALVLQLHHAMTDGVGGMRLLAAFADRAAGGRPPSPRPVPSPATSHGSLSPTNLVTAATHTMRQLARTTWSGAAAAAQAAIHPVGTSQRAANVAASLVRVLRPFTDTLSPMMQQRSDARRLAILEHDLQALHRAARAADATLNDVFVTAVARGLARYHHSGAFSVCELRMTMPISTRDDHDPLGGNRLLPARFAVPVDIDDVRTHVAAVRDRCHTWRHEPALPATDGVAAVLDHLPARLTTWAFGSMLKHVDFLTTNVPGSPVPLYIAGARIQRMWALAPPMGSAVNVSLISHEGVACIGVNMDAAACTEPSTFVECLLRGFADVLSLVPAVEPRVPAEVTA